MNDAWSSCSDQRFHQRSRSRERINYAVLLATDIQGDPSNCMHTTQRPSHKVRVQHNGVCVLAHAHTQITQASGRNVIRLNSEDYRLSIVCLSTRTARNACKHALRISTCQNDSKATTHTRSSTHPHAINRPAPPETEVGESVCDVCVL